MTLYEVWKSTGTFIHNASLKIHTLNELMGLTAIADESLFELVICLWAALYATLCTVDSSKIVITYHFWHWFAETLHCYCKLWLLRCYMLAVHVDSKIYIQNITFNKLTRHNCLATCKKHLIHLFTGLNKMKNIRFQHSSNSWLTTAIKEHNI